MPTNQWAAYQLLSGPCNKNQAKDLGSFSDLKGTGGLIPHICYAHMSLSQHAGTESPLSVQKFLFMTSCANATCV